MQLFYHNHQQEFAADEGERLLDTLAGAMPGLALELDVYWAYRGGADPLAYLEQRRDQVRLLHLKDGTMEHGTEAGRGNLPLAELAACGNRLGIPWVVVETEQSETAAEQLEDARRDLAFLSGLV